MADRTADLIEAVRNRLLADATLTALIGSSRVHAEIAPGAPLPYVEIGDLTAVDAGGMAMDAQEHTLTLHCWTESSRLHCLEMVAAVRASLHDADLTLAAGRCPNMRCEFAETMRDPDGITHHGVLRFRAVTQD